VRTFKSEMNAINVTAGISQSAGEDVLVLVVVVVVVVDVVVVVVVVVDVEVFVGDSCDKPVADDLQVK
jgi:hypothetical protein